MTKFKKGDWVVYRKQKRGAIPTKRAINIHPFEKGEQYSYQIEKFWVVQDVLPDDKVILCTIKGNKKTVNTKDPGLYKASLLQRFFLRNKYRNIERVLIQERLHRMFGNEQRVD